MSISRSHPQGLALAVAEAWGYVPGEGLTALLASCAQPEFERISKPAQTAATAVDGIGQVSLFGTPIRNRA